MSNEISITAYLLNLIIHYCFKNMYSYSDKYEHKMMLVANFCFCLNCKKKICTQYNEKLLEYCIRSP